MTVFEDDNFHLKPCYTCPLPGYLILSAKDRSETLHDLPVTTLSSLGPTLAMIFRSIHAVDKAGVIFDQIFLFTEASGRFPASRVFSVRILSGIRFLLFPVSSLVVQGVRVAAPNEGLCSGPLNCDIKVQHFFTPAELGIQRDCRFILNAGIGLNEDQIGSALNSYFFQSFN